MNAAEWRECNSPNSMLKGLRDKTSERKLRLFACACWRRVWHLLTDARSRNAVDVTERYADGAAREEERQAAQLAAEAVWNPGEEDEADLDNGPAWAADVLVRGQFIGDQWVFKGERWAAIVTELAQEGPQETENQAHCLLLRDVFGNLFHRVARSPTWRTPAVLALAEATYDNRILPTGHLDPQRLGILADALEEAGCTDTELLGHLRGPGPHVRGCWPIDLILNKT